MAYNIIAENEDYTIVSDYQTIYRKSDKYQSEAQLEKEFIKTLTEQGYDYLAIHKEQDLVDNLRVQLQRLNGYTFTDSEWKRFFNDVIANQNEGIEERLPRYRKTISKSSKETLAKQRIST